MTDAWLAPATDYIQSWLDHQLRVSEQPGVAIAVAHRGRLVLEHAAGFADLKAREKLTPRHRFRVASHSKTFTAAGFMKLREQGRVTLEDRAGRFVDGLHAEVAAATIFELLSHGAGLVRDGFDAAYWVDRADFYDAARLARDLAEPPAIAAGLRLKYSNHGFGLLGRILEAVTGEPWSTWIAREIVAASGLTETLPDAPSPGPVARGHSGRVLLGRRLTFPGDQPTHALAAATGFVSTAADLAKFFSSLSPEAETSVLNPASRRDMTRPIWRDPHAVVDLGYGLGTISGKLDGADWFGHSGGFLGYITRTVVIPKAHLTVSVLTNAVDGFAHPWADGALHILRAFAKAGAARPELADWSGRWWSLWGAIDLLPLGDRVLTAMPDLMNPIAKVGELEVSGDHGRIAEASAFGGFGEKVWLERDAAGKVSAVRLGASRLISEEALAAEARGRYEG